MNYTVWEKLAHKYNRLWVQKYSLRPTRREVRKIVLPLIKNNPKIKILEIGCGTGQFIKEISVKNGNISYFGIDAANNMIEIAKKDNKVKNIKFEKMSIEKYKTKETFDLIICTHAFPYFPEKRQMMKKISKLCNKGAKVIIANASNNNLKDKIITFLLKATTSKSQYLSIRDMSKLFDNASLKCIDIKIIKEKRYMPTIALFYLEK
ncbi:MAG: methyltransferase domain-containing protein [Defluviitaleaceae bacterium]|nr:methyltransferase domain-containing protein [Defluviitaleaceae bacterium]